MIAAVVPALNEAETIGATIGALFAAGIAQIIVVDGGSADDTAGRARLAGAEVIRSPAGRGRQMNRGALAAKAELLVFVHADTRLPGDGAAQIRRALSDPAVVGGSFRLSFDDPHPLLAVYGRFSRLESRWTTFGDQAFFMRRQAWRAAGGFPEIPLLEDVVMRRRLRRLGLFVKAAGVVTTSARRFRREGVARRQLLNGLVLALHSLGVAPEDLNRFYR